MRLLTLLPFVLALPAAMIAADFPNPAQLPSQPEPPDLLLLPSGQHVKTKEQWQQQRAPELRALVQHYEYGVMPAKPEHLEGKIIRADKQALGGKATLKEVEVHASKPDAQVHLMIVVPNGRQKPAPCFLGLNFS